jgi:VanZ family protein
MGAASRLVPPLLLMAVMFVLSAQPNLNSGLGTIDLVGRKVVHMGEYGLLFLLWLRATRWRNPLLAAAIAVGYAVTDEWHQMSVAGRHGSPVDVLIDTAGVTIAWAVWLRASRARSR